MRTMEDAIKWRMRSSGGLSCRSFAAHRGAAPGNFLRTLATPEAIKDWSLTRVKEQLIKI
jgi:hypothetical protein